MYRKTQKLKSKRTDDPSARTLMQIEGHVTGAPKVDLLNIKTPTKTQVALFSDLLRREINIGAGEPSQECWGKKKGRGCCFCSIKLSHRQNLVSTNSFLKVLLYSFSFLSMKVQYLHFLSKYSELQSIFFIHQMKLERLCTA